MGTPQQVVTASGQVIWDAHYGAFGQATVTTEIIKNNLRLAGQYFDEETGLHYNYFRYYDPSIGRYITNDPVGLAGGINAYAYVGGNPLYWIDPLGLFSAADLPSVPQPIVDYAAGLFDASSFGIFRIIREGLGIDGGIDTECSSAYRAGTITDDVIGFASRIKAIGKAGKYLLDVRKWRDNSKIPIDIRWKSIKLARDNYHKALTDGVVDSIRDEAIDSILGF